MTFKTKEQLKDIFEGGVYHCGTHDFFADIKDTESIRKHEDEYEHFIKGTAICQRCKKEKVTFKKLPKPPEGQEPGAFCPKCMAALKAQFAATEEEEAAKEEVPS